MKVVLASASPRRKDLLGKLYSDFVIHPSEADETLSDDIGPEFAPIFLAATKGEDIASKYPNDLVIAADTVVVCDGEIFGKPQDDDDAVRMLTALSGKTHKVITGCFLAWRDRTACFSEETYVTFYSLSRDEISKYVLSGEPRGKAGAYAIQDSGALLVEKIEGDYNNVVGLPISRLKREIYDLIKE